MLPCGALGSAGVNAGIKVRDRSLRVCGKAIHGIGLAIGARHSLLEHAIVISNDGGKLRMKIEQCFCIGQSRPGGYQKQMIDLPCLLIVSP